MKKYILLALFTGFSPVFGWTHLSTNIKGWNSKKITFYVDYTNCVLPQSTMNEILDTAINAWNGVPSSGLEVSRATVSTSVTVDQFENGQATEVPLILCDPNMANPNNIPGQMSGMALNSNGHIIYAGVTLNAVPGGGAELSNMDRGEVEVTIAHEIGHALGLGHSSDADALMYFSIGAKQAAILTQDDMDGVAQIYPKSDFSGGAFGCASVHGKTTNQTIAWFWIGLFLVISNVFIFRVRPERLP